MFEDLTPGVTSMALGALRLLRPHKMLAAKKIRVGHFYDGGYMMLDRFENTEAAYSLGIGWDVSWDMDIATLGIPVFQYDPTITQLPEQHALFHWESKWIGGAVNAATGWETLESVIRKNGHEQCRNLILKCDIEGSEWSILQQTPNSVLRQFRQMVFEIHNLAYLANHHDATNVRRAFVNLTASHHVVHVHGNNFGGWSIVGGVPIPSVLEVTLMRKDEGTFTPSDEIFPTPLDMPNDGNRADLYLGRFEF